MVAKQINDKLQGKDRAKARISCVHGFIAADLTFSELLQYVAPLTYWWANSFGGEQSSPSKRTAAAKNASALDRLMKFDVSEELERIFGDAQDWHLKKASVKMRRRPRCGVSLP